IGLYLIMVVRLDLTMPSLSVLTQLFLLTTVHAILMVSAAIVISVQSTSVKAANLLASFVVIPVAVLMQGEAVMLFWGNEQVLWFGIAGVMIIALLLIRVGIAHFQREYLLGREIDNINLKWMARTFVSNFKGEASSLLDWYTRVLSGTLRRIGPAVLFVLLIAAVSIWGSYAWIRENVSGIVASASPEDLAEMEKNISEISEMPDLSDIQGHLSAPFLFLNNTRAVAFISLAGIVSFGVLGIMLYMINVALIGGVYAF